MKFKDFIDVSRGPIYIKRPRFDEIIEYSEEHIGVFDEFKIESIEPTPSQCQLVVLEDTEYEVKLKHARHILGLNNGHGDKENFNTWISVPEKNNTIIAFNSGALETYGERLVERVGIDYDSWNDTYLKITLKGRE